MKSCVTEISDVLHILHIAIHTTSAFKIPQTLHTKAQNEGKIFSLGASESVFRLTCLRVTHLLSTFCKHLKSVKTITYKEITKFPGRAHICDYEKYYSYYWSSELLQTIFDKNMINVFLIWDILLEETIGD